MSLFRHRLLLGCVALSTIGAAFGYHYHLTAKIKLLAPPFAREEARENRNSAVSAPATIIEKNAPSVETTEHLQASALTHFLDQVIADAIQRGTLDPNRLTPQQLALLPEKFRKKKNSGESQLSAEEIAHIEQQIALGDDAPPDPPPQLPCPDPNHLPDNYNNDYNKMVLRERGCKL